VKQKFGIFFKKKLMNFKKATPFFIKISEKKLLASLLAQMIARGLPRGGEG